MYPELLPAGTCLYRALNWATIWCQSKASSCIGPNPGNCVVLPGALETILNVGLNRVTVRGLIAQTGNPKFAWDSYRRFLENFGTVVYSHDPDLYRKIERIVMDEEQVPDEAGLDFAAMRTIAEQYEQLYPRTNGKRLPDNVFSQLELATTTILQSWKSPRAQAFRNMNLILPVHAVPV